MSRLLAEFKEFALKGNLLELAVAFVLGVAFSAVVSSFVDDVIMNLIAALFGEPDFTELTLSLGDGTIRYGAFLTALLSFVIVAFALFWVVKGVNRVRPPAEPATRNCPHCLSSIPKAAPVCAACTRDVEPA